MPSKPVRKVAAKSIKKLKHKRAPLLLPFPAPCSKTFEFFNNVPIGPGQSYDSGTPKSVDCYQWLHVWVLARHPQNRAMDNIIVELVFGLPGKMGAAGLANLGNAYTPVVVPTPLLASSGANVYGGFVIRSPIIGPVVRAIIANNGAIKYDFTVWGYATH